jgi:hypothetical protein
MPSFDECLGALPEFRRMLLSVRPSALQANDTPTFTAATQSPALDFATGIGLRSRGRKPSQTELVLKIYYYLKGQAAQAREFAKIYNGLPVETGYYAVQKTWSSGLATATASAAAGAPAPRARQRPLVGGLAIGPFWVDRRGTLGCLVRRKDGGDEPYLLSATHVLAAVDQLGPGHEIIQPGWDEFSGRAVMENAIATLADTVSLRFGLNPAIPLGNTLDAGIAKLTSPSDFEPSTMFGGWTFTAASTSDSTPQDAEPGTFVLKYGASTGETEGVIDSSQTGAIPVNYGDQYHRRMASFDNVFRVRGLGGKRFADFGDSGAVIFERDTKRPVGLLFATDSSGNASAFPFSAVCDKLGIVPI